MAKKAELSQTQRNHALEDLRSITCQKRAEFTPELPNALEFIIAFAGSKTIDSLIINKNQKANACWRNSRNDHSYSFEVCLLDACGLQAKYSSKCKALIDAMDKKRDKFNKFAHQQEMNIKYGDSADAIMAAFKAIENYKA